jgi:hypothetical protein
MYFDLPVCYEVYEHVPSCKSAKKCDVCVQIDAHAFLFNMQDGGDDDDDADYGFKTRMRFILVLDIIPMQHYCRHLLTMICMGYAFFFRTHDFSERIHLNFDSIGNRL